MGLELAGLAPGANKVQDPSGSLAGLVMVPCIHGKGQPLQEDKLFLSRRRGYCANSF